jgi:hypothetical protein
LLPSTRILPFVLRFTCLCAVSAVPVFITLGMVALGYLDFFEALALGSIALLLAASFTFARWGTILPATVISGDTSVSSASARGNKTMGYAFPRFILCFSLTTLAQIAVLAPGIELNDLPDKYFPETGGFNIALLLATAAYAIVSAFQITITAVILSRAYLLTEKMVQQTGTSSLAEHPTL